MNSSESNACPCRADWTEIEARFQRAKLAMLDAQQRHCEAVHEFLLARAEVKQMLEEIFPEASKAPYSLPVLP